MEKETSPRKAFNALLRMLTRRDHSELELRSKLENYYLPEAVQEALQEAQNRGYLKDPKLLANQFAQAYIRKGKGRRYIEQRLKRRGLPTGELQLDGEKEKALALVQRRFGISEKRTLEEKQKISRFLQSRGFDLEIVRKVIYEES